MILIIDNYDSFTYNLYQIIGELYSDIQVVRNDEISIEEIEKLMPKAIIISPGSGYPKDAGISVDVIKKFSGIIPILGVCLGHQSIVEAFGGEVVKATELMHGKASDISIDTKSKIFRNFPDTIKAARYHSLIAENSSMPACLKVISRDSSEQVMAVEHNEHLTFGLQFHPESILTNTGSTIISNFLKLVEDINVKPITSKKNVSDIPKVALKPYIAKVVDRIDLTESEAMEAMDSIMSGEATDSQISSFLTALRMKGETIDEITGFARGMRKKSVRVKGCESAVDIVGTGGDLASSFNISTTSSFVISAAGAIVAKHGNRSVSSKSGAADVLESLGVKITSTPEIAEKLISKVGLSFLFAQNYHGSMRFVATARREMGIRSVFNILGPLANPAFTDYIVLGTYDKALLEPMAKVLMNVGIKRAMVVYGDDNLDEISISDTTSVCEVNNGKIENYTINPEDYRLKLTEKTEIVGGTPDENAKITLG
ncbi:MAG TPA: anthranilate phosphoribosyltransferase, partial [Clostridiales bacterium]|nr:anthranilate phosphoribosyltransferase [Clostridiales bacterium]